MEPGNKRGLATLKVILSPGFGFSLVDVAQISLGGPSITQSGAFYMP